MFLSLCARFIKKHLHSGSPEAVDAEALRKEVEELRQRNRDLEEEVSQLKATVITQAHKHSVTQRISHHLPPPVSPQLAKHESQEVGCVSSQKQSTHYGKPLSVASLSSLLPQSAS